jgi:ABC-2 type transport system ATP-binding protein
MTASEPAIRLSGVSRVFGSVRALDQLDLTVPTQSITVLLGPNGAGKTTAVRMITGALEAHGGSVEVFGLDPARHGEEVRRRCGVVSAKPALYDRLSGWDNLRYAAELYGLGRRADARIREAPPGSRSSTPSTSRSAATPPA